MIARFMSGTPYAKTEQEMQRVPRFCPRGSGMAVSHFEYSAKDCDCRLCTCYENNCKKSSNCVCLHERLAAGCVPFHELLAILTAEVSISSFVRRITQISDRSEPYFFMVGHRERFAQLWSKHDKSADNHAMCAAIYLLSADCFLWSRSLSAVQTDMIRFENIPIHGVDLDGYTLFHTTKDLYKGTNPIALSELVDPDLVSDDTFTLIITAFLICRYGKEVLNAKM